MTVKNYLKESLSTILCIIIQGEGSSGKDLNCCVHGNLTRLSARNANSKRVLPQRASMLFVSINISLERDSVIFSASCEL